MDCDNIIDVILALGRVLVLIFGMFAGIFSIYLGWKLYKDKVNSNTEANFSSKEYKATLTSAGPGVFLALFGAYLLVSIVDKKLDLSVSNTEPKLQAPHAGVKSGYGADSRPDGLITLVADQAGGAPIQAQPPKCVIYERRRVLFSGEEARRSEEIDRSLVVAIEALELARANGAKTTTSTRTLAEIRTAISNMEDLRLGLEKAKK